jgi:hypothetical protein
MINVKHVFIFLFFYLEKFNLFKMSSVVFTLNTPSVQTFTNPMFVPVLCSDQACNNVVYASNDPKLCSAGHSGQRIVLDKPPANGDLFTVDGLNPSIECSNLSSTGYKDSSYINLRDGSIQYYYDVDLATPFTPYLFDSKHRIIKETYTDPMGICKPHYFFVETQKADTPESCLGCPTWLRDSQFHREDMLSRQLAKINQNSYQVNLHMSGCNSSV